MDTLSHTPTDTPAHTQKDTPTHTQMETWDYNLISLISHLKSNLHKLKLSNSLEKQMRVGAIICVFK